MLNFPDSEPLKMTERVTLRLFHSHRRCAVFYALVSHELLVPGKHLPLVSFKIVIDDGFSARLAGTNALTSAREVLHLRVASSDPWTVPKYSCRELDTGTSDLTAADPFGKRHLYYGNSTREFVELFKRHRGRSGEVYPEKFRHCH